MTEPNAASSSSINGVRNTQRKQEMITQLENQIIQMIYICVALEGVIYTSVFTDHSAIKCKFNWLPTLLSLNAGAICLYVIVLKTLQVRDLMTAAEQLDDSLPVQRSDSRSTSASTSQQPPSTPQRATNQTPQLPVPIADQGYSVATTFVVGDGIHSCVFLNPPTIAIPPFPSWVHLYIIVGLCFIFVISTAVGCYTVCCSKA